MPQGARALHWVFKIGQRELTMKFYREILGMKVLRHEEFSEGCIATCNGPYAGKWSKTMIGYGSEDDNFVVELTYNYGINSYKKGNEFLGITIRSDSILKKAAELDWPVVKENDLSVLEAPGGYKYYIINEKQKGNPIEKVTISCSDLKKSLSYWNGLLGVKVYERTEKSAIVGFADNQVRVELKQSACVIDRAEAYGRIAFSCPKSEQPATQEIIKSNNYTILNPLTELDTPGKETVRVLILGDPDGHEICFVEDEGFRRLSIPDTNGDELLNNSIQEDKSISK